MVREIVKMLQKHGSQHNSKTIQVTSIKLNMLIGDNVLIMHISFVCHHMQIVVAVVTETVIILLKHLDPNIIP